MSKTEHDLTSADADEALDELFADAAFDEALNDALEEADVELEVDDLSVDEADDDETGEAHAVAELHETEQAAEVADLDDDADDGTAPRGARPPSLLDDPDPSGDFSLPPIVPATPEPEVEPVEIVEARDFVPPGDPVAPDTDDGNVSDDILEELRRADIDGPVVDLAPQDDTASARRRPRRSADYDPAPVPIPAQIPRVLGRKPRVRKVTRVVRHVDPWSVFKIALVASAVLYVIMLTAGVLLWNVAYATGTVDNVERFFESFGWETFTFNGGEIYHAAWIAGLFGVIGLTGLAVLAATLFNLITDLVGGMRFTVLEEEVVETRVSPMRRFVVRRAEPEVPAVLHDQSGSMIREAVVDDTGANERPSR